MIILASTSQTRQRLLSDAGVVFEAIAPGVDEDELKLSLNAQGASPRSIADALAETKAVKVSQRFPGPLVLGADQVLTYGSNQMLDKPGDMAAARDQLLTLRGQEHSLISAVVIAHQGKAVWRFVDTAKLWMRNFSETFLEEYLAAVGPLVLTSVGGYQLEKRGAQLFSRVSGDHFTIQGLPLLPVLDYLRTRQVLPA
jgi:septum formation protein